MYKKIPFMDLSDCYEDIYDEVVNKIKSLIDNTRFIGGEEIKKFENEYAEFSQTKYAVGCSNGTDALMLAMKALGIGEGDTVLTVPHTFISSAEVVTEVGANVEFVDIEEDYYTMDPNKLEKYLKQNNDKNIKAIIVVHLYGQMANMEKIKKIADKHNLKIIEDSAQAHGSELNGKRPGYYGDIATFSFYPGKNLGAFGDGGAIVTNNFEYYKKAKMYSNHGRWKEKYEHEIEGGNYRLDTIQAGILRIKLKYLEKWNNLRKEKADLYKKYLKNKNIILPKVRKGADPVYHLFVIRTNKRDEVQKKLKEKGISTGIHYPIPLHLQPAYNYKNLKKGDFPVSEKVADEVLSLPFWPEIKEGQIVMIGNLIK